MFERFTKDGRKVVTVAIEEARRRGDARVGTEHLLLGVFDSEVLESLGLSPDTLRRELDRLDGEALESVGVDPSRFELEAPDSRSENARRRHIPFTGAAKTTLKNALQEAMNLKHRSIGAGARRPRLDHSPRTRPGHGGSQRHGPRPGGPASFTVEHPASSVLNHASSQSREARRIRR
ncbi:MAG: Clp protease N-terminal domain-containing protein [Acidimicrobiia bacterium]